MLRAVVLVDFPNARASQAPAGWRRTDPYSEWLAPAATWLRTASYGKVRVSITPVDTWYRMSRRDIAYGMDRSLTFDEHIAYVAEAVALADDDIDSPSTTSSTSSHQRMQPASRISRFVDPGDERIVADGVAVTHGATFGQNIWEWGPFGYRVLAHETGHLFGLPDLYAFDSGGTHRYVGGWDLMGTLSGSAPDLFAWEKWKLGWISDAQVACVVEAGTRRIRLTAVERSDGTKLVVVPTSPTAAYIIESRRAIGNDADCVFDGGPDLSGRLHGADGLRAGARRGRDPQPRS